MSRLNENQVERLLQEAARWEPDAQMPESLIRSALTKSPRRRSTPLLPVLSMSGAAMAGLMAFVVFRPEIPTNVVPPTPAPMEQAQNGATSAAPIIQPTPATFVAKNPPVKSEPQAPDKQEPRASANKSKGRSESARRKKSRGYRRSSESQLRNRSQEVPGKLEYAPYQNVNEPKPLPEDAISLDESPKIVPVVISEPDEETGGVRLSPGAVAVPAPVVDEPISLE